MFIKTYLAIAALILFGATSADARPFKALRDFAAINPNDTWSYGYGPTMSEFTLYDTFTHDCFGRVGIDCWEASPPDAFNAQVAVNVTGAPFAFAGSALAVTNALLLHPGAGLERTIVRWTCPGSGTYEISGFFEILDKSPTGVRPRILVDGKNVNIAAFGDTGELTGPGANLTTLTPGQKKTFTFTGFVKRGHVIAFGISPKGDYSNDTTGFNAVITRVGP
jgi:hypothetical protein